MVCNRRRSTAGETGKCWQDTPPGSLPIFPIFSGYRRHHSCCKGRLLIPSDVLFCRKTLERDDMSNRSLWLAVMGLSVVGGVVLCVQSRRSSRLHQPQVAGSRSRWSAASSHARRLSAPPRLPLPAVDAAASLTSARACPAASQTIVTQDVRVPWHSSLARSWLMIRPRTEATVAPRFPGRRVPSRPSSRAEHRESVDRQYPFPTEPGGRRPVTRVPP